MANAVLLGGRHLRERPAVSICRTEERVVAEAPVALLRLGNHALADAVERARLPLPVDEHEDGLTVHPGPLQPGVVETYDDHRMAMSFAVAGLRTEGLAIADPGCTSKTYPDFFEDLDRLCRVNQ